MEMSTTGPVAATSTLRRRLVGLLGSRRPQLVIAVLFGSLIGGGFVAATAGRIPGRDASVHSIVDQFRNGYTDGSGYDQDGNHR